MRLDEFVAERGPEWAELESAVKKAGVRPERLGSSGVLRLGSLYRAAAADLALVRREWPGDPLQRRLEVLVTKARHLVYDRASRRESVVEFFRARYWERVAERPALLLVAAALLFVPMIVTAVWAAANPAEGAGLVPDIFGGAVDPPEGDLGMSVVQQAASATSIFINNIQVTFLSFGGGIAAGAGTTFIDVYNGITIGGIAGLAFEGGAGSRFVTLVIPHGVLELSCIVVASAGGLRMGWSIVSPGSKRRGEALATAAREGAEVVLGTMPWLVLAGLIEGFVTPAGIGLGPAIVVGVALGVVYWTLVALLGVRPLRRARAASR